MKITVEIPDTTVCAFVNYVFASPHGMSMGARAIDSADLAQGCSKMEGFENDGF